MSPQVTPQIPLQSILNRWQCSQFCCRLGDIYSNIVIQTILNIFSAIDSNLDKSDFFFAAYFVQCSYTSLCVLSDKICQRK